MALVLLTEPTPTSPPSSPADWGYAQAKQTAALQAFTGRSIVDGSTIHAGTVILVGNALYKSTTDTTISGTPSLYVKITPSGASATASFVSSLSGVSWNFVTGQYVDGSGNIYLFDEARAINEGILSTARTMQGQISHLAGGLNINGALTGATSISVSHSLSGNRTSEIKNGFAQVDDIEPGETRVITWNTTSDTQTIYIGDYNGGSYPLDALFIVGDGGSSGGSGGIVYDGVRVRGEIIGVAGTGSQTTYIIVARLP